MRQPNILLALILVAAACRANPPSAPPPMALGAPRAQRPPAVPPTTQIQTATDDQDPARFSSEERWALAGYNNEEVIYTIIITSHDTRIIRCSTLLTGAYYENGIKTTVSDRQSSTVFPDQKVQAGNWIGMDQKSGTTFSVKCHPV